jgi:hypothetical protein
MTNAIAASTVEDVIVGPASLVAGVDATFPRRKE